MQCTCNEYTLPIAQCIYCKLGKSILLLFFKWNAKSSALTDVEKLVQAEDNEYIDYYDDVEDGDEYDDDDFEDDEGDLLPQCVGKTTGECSQSEGSRQRFSMQLSALKYHCNIAL